MHCSITSTGRRTIRKPTFTTTPHGPWVSSRTSKSCAWRIRRCCRRRWNASPRKSNRRAESPAAPAPSTSSITTPTTRSSRFVTVWKTSRWRQRKNRSTPPVRSLVAGRSSFGARPKQTSAALPMNSACRSMQSTTRRQSKRIRYAPRASRSCTRGSQRRTKAGIDSASITCKCRSRTSARRTSRASRTWKRSTTWSCSDQSDAERSRSSAACRCTALHCRGKRRRWRQTSAASTRLTTCGPASVGPVYRTCKSSLRTADCSSPSTTRRILQWTLVSPPASRRVVRRGWKQSAQFFARRP